jgi:hypothetical protein
LTFIAIEALFAFGASWHPDIVTLSGKLCKGWQGNKRYESASGTAIRQLSSRSSVRKPKQKRSESFLPRELTAMADRAKGIVKRAAPDTFLGRKTQEPFPKEEHENSK